mgnify:CR=1 FL=1
MDTPKQFHSLGRQKRLIIKFVLLSFTTACQSSFSGRITDKSGNSITAKDGYISIVSLSESIDRQITVPINNGYFELDGELEHGYYFIETLIPGYNMTSMRIHYDHPLKLNIKVIKNINNNYQNFPIHSLRKHPTNRGTGKVSLNPPNY